MAYRALCWLFRVNTLHPVVIRLGLTSPCTIRKSNILMFGVVVLFTLPQIRGSSGQAREALKRHFTELQAAAGRLLSERLAGLLAEVDAIEADSIKPLDDCQSLIEHGVGQADELLREGGSPKLAA